MKGGKAKTETKKADSRLAVKRKTSERASKAPAKMAGKDPSKPKRAASAFFVFLEEFSTQYKEQHPENKSVATVGKAAGVKWKSMSDAEKSPYVNKSNKRKAELQKAVSAPEKKKNARSSNRPVGKAAGLKWKSMSDAEKASYISKPKRAPSAFFAFPEEFRQQYNEQHPENKSIAAVGEAAGVKWQSMSDAEKASYVSKPKRAPSAFFASPEEFPKQYNEQHSENKSIAAVAEAAGVKWKSMSDAEKASYTSKPMRAPSAFFAFLREEFRKQYEEQYPENKSIAAVGKAAGVEWKSMSDAEKASYVCKYAP